MPNLSLAAWEKYVPTLGDNKTQERPFFLMVKSGLTRTQFEGLLEKVGEFRNKKDNSPEALVGLFGDLVKLGDEPLSVDGEPIKDLLGYMRLVASQVATPLLVEMVGAIRHFNSVEGVQEAFFARLSGGQAFIASTAPKTVGASPGGSGTSPS